MAKKTDEEKILFTPYISVSTIQRYFGLSKVDANDLFVKTQEFDEKNGFKKLFEDRVRSEGVFEILGLDLCTALKRYEIRKGKR